MTIGGMLERLRSAGVSWQVQYWNGSLRGVLLLKQAYFLTGEFEDVNGVVTAMYLHAEGQGWLA